MNDNSSQATTFGKWMALTAALLGWLFDGLEMGLFPLTARAALLDLGIPEDKFPTWLGVITAFFLVGAATGGVLFGWLGDRLGRVRAMMLSVLTYALVSGLGGFATSAWQLGVLRFIAALGMGGEWSLGVALINEIWPARSRAFLAGLIGAAANVGYLIIALVGRAVVAHLPETNSFLLDLGLPSTWVDYLVNDQNKGWRLLMLCGALPALLTFFIRLCVPESHRWERERARGATSHWANRDLLGVLIGAAAACAMITLFTTDLPVTIQLPAAAVCVGVVTLGYIWPVIFYLRRTNLAYGERSAGSEGILGRMLLAACLSGVALLGTWGTIQQAPTWAGTLRDAPSTASSLTQIWSSVGAILGTILAAFAADWFGRRVAYTVMCFASFVIVTSIFQASTSFDDQFLLLSFLGGAITASFYGWLPLYLPELFPTRVRATGQGFGFNFGRIIAAVGVLQLSTLKDFVQPYGWGQAEVFTMLSSIYFVGMVIIWFAPETKGKPLPD